MMQDSQGKSKLRTRPTERKHRQCRRQSWTVGALCLTPLASDARSEALPAHCSLQLGPHWSHPPLQSARDSKPLPGLPFEKGDMEEETAGSRLMLGRYQITFSGGRLLIMPNWKPNYLLSTQILLKTMVSEAHECRVDLNTSSNKARFSLSPSHAQ